MRIENKDFEEIIHWNKQSSITLGQLTDDVFVPSEVNFQVQHRTESQIKMAFVDANESTLVMPRGTGKTEYIHAYRSFKCMTRMPGARGGFVGRSYAKLMENILPGLIKGWKALGWRRNEHYWVKEKPPKSLEIPAPYGESLDSSHSIFCYTGAAMSMISQDRKGSANSMTLHWVQGDELKFLDRNSIDTELRQANRGDTHLEFSHLPEFHSWLWTTDMPTSREGMWILEQEKKMQPDRVQLLLDIQVERYELVEKLMLADVSRRKGILDKIAQLDKYWDAIRAHTFWYHEPQGHDNIDGFGKKQILDLKRTLPTFIFRTSILNKRPYLSENAFYPDLKDRLHCYDATDEGYIDRNLDAILDRDMKLDDCRKDADLDTNLPLHIALDYGSSFNALCVGQIQKNRLLFVNAMYVKHPQRLAHLITNFVNYYRFHPTKTVIFHYDHTAFQGSNALIDIKYADEVIGLLKAAHWNVIKNYIGHTPSPETRYEDWGKSFKGTDPSVYPVLFNRDNCEYLLTAMRLTSLKEGSKNYQKDKTDERNPNVDQLETTHFPDAADTLLLGTKFFKRKSKGLDFDVAA
ncbi:hypothetical protein [Runella zeae]|uniref:hypothetical protein n=1 Tax=Runella zeae TaxID=94255 RepID=UPI0004100F86|nr:hypothetical protein [Runella zeae]